MGPSADDLRASCKSCKDIASATRAGEHDDALFFNA